MFMYYLPNFTVLPHVGPGFLCIKEDTWGFILGSVKEWEEGEGVGLAVQLTWNVKIVRHVTYLRFIGSGIKKLKIKCTIEITNYEKLFSIVLSSRHSSMVSMAACYQRGPGFKSRQGQEFINFWIKRKFNNSNLNTIIVWVYELTGLV